MLFNKLVKVGEIVRNRSNRHCYLIVNKTSEGIFIVDLMERDNDPARVDIILPGLFDKYDRDIEIDDIEEWEAKSLKEKLPLLDDLEYHNDRLTL